MSEEKVREQARIAAEETEKVKEENDKKNTKQGLIMLFGAIVILAILKWTGVIG